MSKNDGSKNNFYEIPEWVKDVDDLAEYLKLSFDEGNILKSLWCKIGDRHDATNPMREARKCVHYSERRLNRYIHAQKSIDYEELEKRAEEVDKRNEALDKKLAKIDELDTQIRFKKNPNA